MNDDQQVVNGKRYSLWPQFVASKAEWIGGTLEDLDPDARGASTKITDVYFKPNGAESAVFGVDGEDFGCASDVQYLAVDPHICGEGWMGFIGYGGHQWRIKKHD